MVKKYLNTFISLLLLSLPFYYPSPAEGRWVQNGTPVTRGAAASKIDPSITATGDGSGSAFVVWEELSVSPGDIYFQKIDINGIPLFESDRDVTVNNSAHKELPAIVNDGSGGAFVVWVDYRNGSDTDIYIQRIDGSGNTVWSEDKAVCSASGIQQAPRLALTSDGDVIIVWEDHRSSVSQIYAQRIDKSSGSPVWTPNGIAVSASSGQQFSPAISSDGYDGAVVVWEDQRNISTTGSDIYAQRIDSFGTGQWGSNEIAVTNAAGDQFFPAIATDGQNHFVITWEDYRFDNAFIDIYAKGVDFSGFTLFGDKVICSIITGRKDAQKPAIAYSANEDSFIIAWEDYRNNPDDYTSYISDIYAQKINWEGDPFWTANGVAVSTSNDYQEAPSIASSDSRGVIAAWQDLQSGTDYDIYSIPLPVPGSIIIKGDETSTTEATVDLTLSATGIGNTITQMRLRNDNPDWLSDSEGWESYSTTETDWSLTDTEGVRTVYVQFKDADGNISPAYFDDIALSYIPTGSISINEVYNSGTAKYTNSTSVNLTISGTNAAWMSFSNDKTTWSSWETYSATPTTKTGWSLTSGDGQKTVYVRFKDQYGNISSIYYSDGIILDTTAPTGTSVTITNPITIKDGITYTNSPTVTLTVFASDGTGSGVSKMIFSNNDFSNSGTLDNYANTKEWNLNFNPLSTGDGHKKVYAKFMDHVNVSYGNTIVSNSVTLDTTKPSSSIASPGSGTKINGTTYIIAGTASDSGDTGSGVSKVELSLDNGTTWTDATEATQWTYTWNNIPANTEANYTIKTRATDVAGNVETPGSGITVTVDTKPPVTSASPAGGSYDSAQSVTLSCNDGTGCDKVYYTTDGSTPTTSSSVYTEPISITADGTTNLKYFAIDTVGNTESVKTETYDIDTTAPSTAASPYGGMYGIARNVTLTCTDNSGGSGCAATYYTTDGSTPNTSSTAYSGPITISATTTLKFFSKDNSGNSELVNTLLYTIDLTSPSSTITYPTSGARLNGTSYTIQGTAADADSGVNKVEISLDNGANWNDVSGTSSWTYLWTSPSEGTYYIKTRATDNVQRAETPGSVTVTIDRTAPSVSSTTPSAGATEIPFDSTVTIEFSESIVNTPSNIFLKQGDVIIDSTVSYDDETTTATLTPASLLSEYTTYTVVATTGVDDIAGNPMVSSYSFSFTTADITNPISTISSPANGSIISTAFTPNITGTSYDTGSTGLPGSGVSKVEVSINDTWQAEAATGTTSWTYPLPTAEGTYTIQTRATDSAGNVEVYGTGITVTVDNTPPTGAITINGGAAYTNTLDVALTISASDAGSGIAKMQYGDALKGKWETYAASASTTLHSGDGTKTIYIQFMDAAGNTSEIYSDTINLDTVATNTGTIDAVTTPTNSTSQTITGTVEAGASVYVATDTAASDGTAAVTGTTWSYNITGLVEGVNNITVTVTDAAGNSTTMTSSITLDTTPPEPEGTSPAVTLEGLVVVPGQTNPSYSYSNFTVSWPSYSDSAGIREYDISVGDASGSGNVKDWLSVGTETSVSTGDLQSLFETYKNANGEYFGKTFYLSVKAIDIAGNESTVLSVPFVYTPAEINSKADGRDGTVDGFDLGMLGIAYNPFGSVPSGYEAADINRDGKVDNDDLFILAVNFGKVKQ